MMGDLPSGLNLDSSSGVISGTPDSTGPIQTVIFTATDDYDSSTSTKSVSFPAVTAASGPTWSIVYAPGTLRTGTAITNFTLSATSESGMGTVTYTDMMGDLPSGLNLDADTGVISGTPN